MNSSREVKHHLDQITISLPCSDIKDYYKIIEEFEKDYGTGYPIMKYVNDIDFSGTHFKRRNFFISKLKKFRFFLTLSNDSVLYNQISSTVSRLKKQKLITNFGKNIPLLSRLEISFDFLCSNHTIDECLLIADNFSQHIIPVYDGGIYKDVFTSGNNKMCTDGRINLDFTNYYHKARRKTMFDEFPTKSKKMLLDYKLYPKNILSDLYLREEVTLSRKAIKKLNLTHPRFYSQIEKALLNVKFEDYWKYVTVNYEMFIDDYNNLVKYKNIPPLSQWVMNVLEYDWEPGRIYMMRHLAKKCAGNYLYSRLRKYIHIHTVEEMYDAIDNALSWN